MKIIGIVGRNGAGKRTLASYLNKWCAIPIVSIPEMTREIAASLGMEPTQPNLVEVSRRAIERDGVEAFANRAIQELEDRDWQVALIAGIRTPAEVRVLRDYYRQDFMLVLIRVSDWHERYERIRKRDGPLAARSYDEFLQQERLEQGLFDLDATIDQADLQILNDSRLEDLHLEIERTLIEKELADAIPCAGEPATPT
jgi:dephospho-CoA kinase